MENRLTRIGIFYDGNFFSRISNFYNYHHNKRSRISVSGLHDFLKFEICKAEGGTPNYYKIVDAHYFRERLSAVTAKEQNTLYRARVFDEILITAGVVTHYLPISIYNDKGSDVYLALEAFELSSYRKFDIVVLAASGIEYLPLIRKLNTLGIRVVVLGWNIKYLNEQGEEQEISTSRELLEEATYPLHMNTIIEDPARKREPLLENLFVKAKDSGGARAYEEKTLTASEPLPEHDREILPLEFGFMSPVKEGRAQQEPDSTGKVMTLENGVGSIKPNSGEDNLFFHYKELQNVDFNDLKEGDQLIYRVSKIGKTYVAKGIRLMQRKSDRLP